MESDARSSFIHRWWKYRRQEKTKARRTDGDIMNKHFTREPVFPEREGRSIAGGSTGGRIPKVGPQEGAETQKEAEITDAPKPAKTDEQEE